MTKNGIMAIEAYQEMKKQYYQSKGLLKLHCLMMKKILNRFKQGICNSLILFRDIYDWTKKTQACCSEPRALKRVYDSFEKLQS